MFLNGCSILQHYCVVLYCFRANVDINESHQYSGSSQRVDHLGAWNKEKRLDLSGHLVSDKSPYTGLGVPEFRAIHWKPTGMELGR